jgi:predicted dehydrogenase
VLLSHEAGPISLLSLSSSEGAPGGRFRITGTDGSYVVDSPMDGQEAVLLAGDSPATLGDAWGVEPEERWGSIRRGADHEVVPTMSGVASLLRAVCDCSPGSWTAPVDPHDAIQSLRVLDAARCSATSGKVEHVR